MNPATKILFALSTALLLMLAAAAAPWLLAPGSVPAWVSALCALAAAATLCAAAFLNSGMSRLRLVRSFAEDLARGRAATPPSPTPSGEAGGILEAVGSLLGAMEAAREEARTQTSQARAQADETMSALDEARALADKGQSLAASMAEAAHRARPISGDVFSAVEELTGRIDGVNDGVGVQRDRMTETAAAMEEMNATVMEVARNASNAAASAARSRENAQTGAQGVHRAVASMQQIEQRMGGLKETMGQLGAKADGIGQIIDVINEIADQTNLLALNAAIEAARAGDAGRGFAVVADEVRKLAEKTMTATQEVGRAIQEIQQTAQDNIRAVDSTAGFITESTEAANEAGRFMEEIVVLVEDTAAQVESIATASEEQSAASEEINMAVTDVTRVAGETAEGMAAAASALMEISSLVEELDSMIQSLENADAAAPGRGTGKLVSWDDSLSVGVKAIDKQHMTLIDLINELHAAMRGRKGDAILLDVVKRLKDYTVTHFRFEETLFDKHGYPDTREHKAIHKKFVDTVAKFDADLRSGRATVSMDVLRFLKQWLIDHIKGTDRQYGPFLNAKGVR